MLGVVWYLASVAMAYQWLVQSRLAAVLSLGELRVMAVPVGTLVGAWVVYLTACVLGSLSVGTILVATGGVGLALLARLPSLREVTQVAKEAGWEVAGKRGVSVWSVMPRPRWTTDDTVAAVFMMATAVVFWPLYSLRMIPTDADGNIITAGSCYGDLPIHMTIANSFLVGVNQRVGWGTMMSPIFAGEMMTYPFLPDFHAAILVRLGTSMRWGFLLPGFLLATSLWGLLYYLTVRVTRSRLGGILAACMTMGAGGLGGWRWAQERGWDAALQADVVQHDPTGEWKYLWFAFVPHILLPQRGGNFAYPMALASLLLAWVASDDRAASFGKLTRRSALLHAAVFAGTLPLMQAHAFIGLGIIIAALALGDVHKWARDSSLLASWAAAGVVAFVLGWPQMTMFRHTVAQGFYGNFITYGWLFLKYEFGQPGGVLGFLRFWVYSLGPVVPLFLLAIVVAGLEATMAFMRGRVMLRDVGATAMARQLEAMVETMTVTSSITAPNPPASGGKSGDQLTEWPASGVESLVDAVLTPVAAGADLLLAPVRLRASQWFHATSAANLLSATHRAWDTVKLGLGAFAVFLLGNYVNLQPWERDNAKLFYMFIFVASAVNGALLASPLEHLLHPVLPGMLAPLAQDMPVPLVRANRKGNEAAASAAIAGAAMPPTSRMHSWLLAVQSLLPGGCDAPATPTPTASADATKYGKATGGNVGRPPLLLVPVSFVALALAAGAFFFAVLSGFMMLYEERHLGQGVLFDRDAQRMGSWMIDHVHPRAVVMHSNYHVQASGGLAGRPSLVAYYGWVSNHGYNANERLGDRDYVMDNALKDEDERAVFLLRRWGVRYVLGYGMKRHERAKGADPDTFLNGSLKRVFAAGGHELFEVQGYAFPPP